MSAGALIASIVDDAREVGLRQHPVSVTEGLVGLTRASAEPVHGVVARRAYRY